ncbi:amino acid adenylation domain-containing protein [Kitasatospora sp. NPDC059803]|uniref:amino acid adenylation domain-containing protein n=1 Tax=Kitasatospora sp. NPDC059803 TaxID=3346953 RepID=UPI0036518AE1
MNRSDLVSDSGPASDAEFAFPLSAPEFGIWLTCRDQPESFNIHRVWELRGQLDEQALKGAVEETVARHPVFARRLVDEDGVPSWVPGAPQPRWTAVDTAAVDTASVDTAATADAAPWAPVGRHRFDLRRDCPVRVDLFRHRPDHHVLSLLVHHIACDGASLENLLADIGAAYNARTAGGPPFTPEPEPVPEPPTAAAPPTTPDPPAPAEPSRFWPLELADAQWPEALPRTPGPRTAEADVLVLPLPPDEADAVRAAARRLRVTPYLMGLAALYAAFATQGNAPDVMVATPFASRTPATVPLVGCFARMVPLRQRWPSGASGAELCDGVRRTVAEALSHAHEPIHESADLFDAAAPGLTVSFQLRDPLPGPALGGLAVRAMEAVREPAAAPVADTPEAPGATEATEPPGSPEVPDALEAPGAAPPAEHPGATIGLTRFDLEFDLCLRADDASVTVTRRMRGGTTNAAAAELLAVYRRVLLALARDPGAPLPRSTSAATPSLIVAPTDPSEHAQPLMERFDAWVRTQPQRPAVRCGDDLLTFAGLDREVARLAAALRRHGAGPGTAVGVLRERGVSLVASVLAAWRVRAHVVALDPSQPDSRLAYVVADTGTRVVLCDPASRHRLDASLTIVDEAPDTKDAHAEAPNAENAHTEDARDARPHDLAYVLHTSGTTGRPKGVMVEHRGLAVLVDAQPAGAGAARVGVTAAVSFDVFFQQLLYLFRGSCLVVADQATYRDPQALVEWVERNDVRLLSTSPSMFAAMRPFGVEEMFQRTGLELDFGGEAVDATTWRRLRELGVRGSNGYGPTEVTIQTTWCGFDEYGIPSIGRPLDGTSAYVLGADLRPVPVGSRGELYLAGPLVTRGYLDAPALTAERYLPDPFAPAPGARMYRTGDRVTLGADGHLIYHGRTDHQLKVRGQRVDPYEVEEVLRAAPGVQDAYVARRGPTGTAGLLAWVTPRRPGPVPVPGELRGLAARRLAPAAVPAHIEVVDAFPLTLSGKVDERALPVPAPVRPPDGGADPVVRLWALTLGRPPASNGDNFFSCGGSSLDAARLVAEVNQECGVRVDLASFFGDPTPEGLRHLIARAAPAGGEGPSTAAPAGLSAAQRRLWLLHRAEPDSHEFTVYWALRLSGPLDPARLQSAWRDVLTAHPETRLRVIDDDVAPGRGQWPLTAFTVGVRDVPGHALAEHLRRVAHRPFDLFEEPLVELRVLRTGPEDHVLVFVGHHLVLDRRSTELITEQLLSRLAGGPALPPASAGAVPGPSPAEAERLRRFWAEELAGVCAHSPVALGGPRPGPHRRTAATVGVPLDAAQWRRVTEAARTHRTTALVLVLSAFAVTADRYGAAGDVLVGTTMDVRPPGFSEAVGLFVNPVPVRLRPRPGGTAGEAVAQAHAALLRAHAHRAHPFDELVRELGLRAGPGQAPLFQVLVDHEQPATATAAPPGVRARPVEIPPAIAKYDVEILLRETPDGARLDVLHRTDRWTTDQAWQLAERIRGALLALAAEPSAPAALPVALDPGRLPLEWGRGPEPFAPVVPVSELVARIAREAPERTAVVAGGEQLTYGRLRADALDLAARLTARGAGRGARVAVLTERSAGLMTALLGVHFAGAAYVPLDPRHPDSRMAACLADCGASAVVTDAAMAGRAASFGLPLVPLLPLAPLPSTADPGADRSAEPAVPLPPGPHDPAYVIYTSGTTGRPKGVVIEHGTLAASTAARRTVYPGRPVFLLLSPAAFDSAAAGIWGTLSAGGRLVVASDDEVRDPEALVALIARHQVTRLLCVPSLHALLLTAADRAGPDAVRSLREVVTAGEPLPDELLRRHFAVLPRVALVNEYGPTEATVWASYRRYHGPEAVDIGGPVPGYRLYVLDHALRPVPPGVDGELYVGGAGVGRGYVGRPAETAGAFLPDPFSGEPGARMYRTGDRVRWRAPEALAFVGRLDHQIKVRGHRVQPAEVEAALRGAEGVREAAVVADGGARLVGFVTGGGRPEAVRREVAELLPEFMVPAAVHGLERLPLTPNGKVDRRALEQEADRRRASALAQPAGDVSPGHAAVTAAWREVLGVVDVPGDVNFFDLGGHSLLVPALQEALHRHTGVRLPILDLFRHSTVADLAARLARPAGATTDTPPAPGADPPPSAGSSRRRRGDAARTLRDRRAQEADR